MIVWDGKKLSAVRILTICTDHCQNWTLAAAVIDSALFLRPLTYSLFSPESPSLNFETKLFLYYSPFFFGLIDK
jgi:hypothetical protein